MFLLVPARGEALRAVHPGVAFVRVEVRSGASSVGR